MDLESAMELGRNAFWMALSVSAPILVIGLAVGLAIALFQAVTQLQEQALTFVPKIAAMVIAASFFIAWIGDRMVVYTRQMLGTSPW